jgi:hypothetical protein
MSYTNAEFCLDYENGSDAARSDLVPVGYADNGAGIVRVTVTANTLVTGAVVDISGTTGNIYAGGWKITIIDSTHFDLNGSTFTSNPDTKGTCVPRGGDTWANAWKTITSGATAARITPGDTIKIAKSPAPTSIGNATWTDRSKTVTLATAQTINVCRCETGWTVVSATSAATIGTDWKEGTYAVKIIEDATPTANEIQAYFATGTLNLSPYQKISFWIKNEVAITSGQWVLNLYSTADATGAPVDTISIPAIPSVGRWLPLTLARDGGGDLGSLIQSIAIVNGSSVPTASKYIYLDNIIACTTNGLNLQSLISKNTLEQMTEESANYGNEPWFGIQSINGVTVLIDNGTNTLANAGRGYSTSGTSPETVATYKRETIKTAMATGSATGVQTTQKAGVVGSYITYEGGYNTSTGNKDGETFFDGLNGIGLGIYLTMNFLWLKQISGCRYDSFVDFNAGHEIHVEISCCCNNEYGYNAIGYGMVVERIISANNNTTGLYLWTSGNVIIKKASAFNNTNGGMSFNFTSSNLIKNLTCINNGNGIQVDWSSTGNVINNFTSAKSNTAAINFSRVGQIDIGTWTCSDTTPFVAAYGYAETRIRVNRYNGSYAKTITDGGNIISQASTLSNGSGTEWKLTTETNTNRDSGYPLKLPVAKIAVAANKEVSVSLWFKKAHATNIAAYLFCEGGQIAGVDADLIATAANNTDEQQLTISFTPTESGVVEIEARAYYVAGHSNVIVDALTVSQED